VKNIQAADNTAVIVHFTGQIADKMKNNRTNEKSSTVRPQQTAQLSHYTTLGDKI